MVVVVSVLVLRLTAVKICDLKISHQAPILHTLWFKTLFV